jgi:hypothetical protein
MKVLLVSIAMLAVASMAQAQEKTKKTVDKKEVVAKKKMATTPKSTESAVSEKLPITFSNVLIERNNIAYDADELFVFDFKNTGTTPVIIQNVQTSCGCTTADKPVEPIQPGEKSKISVKYDTKRVGDFVKTISVTTNVTTEVIVLTIKGKVMPATAEN